MIDLNFNEFIYIWGTQAILFLAGIAVGLGIAYYHQLEELKQKLKGDEK